MERLARLVCDALIRLGGVLVPWAERADWVAEWRAEVDACWAASSPTERWRIVRRCLGAIPDGAALAWLRFSPSLAPEAIGGALREGARAPWALASAVAAAALLLATTSVLLAWAGGEMARGRSGVPSRLVVLKNRWEAGRGSGRFPFSVAELTALREQATSVRAVGGYSWGEVRWATEAGRHGTASGATATTNLFEIAGLRTIHGRSFESADEAALAEPVVLLGAACWRESFGGDRAALGRRVDVAGTKRRIVGVVEESRGVLPDVDFWIPLAIDPAQLGRPNARSLRLVALLAPGVRAEQARAEIARILAELPIPGGADPPESFDRVAVETWGARRDQRDLARAGLLALSLLGLALVARCVAGTPPTRALAVLVAAIPCALPLARLARVHAATWLEMTAPSGPALLLAALATSTWFLAASGRPSGSSPGTARVTARFLGGALLVASAALLVRVSLPAFRPTGLATDDLLFVSLRLDSPAAEPELSSRLMERLAGVPGVEQLTIGTATPFGQIAGSVSVREDDRIVTAPPELAGVPLREADYHFVDPGYFATLGIPLRGANRIGAGEVVINEKLAHALEPEGRVIGRRLRIPARERTFTVVGVAPDLLLRDPGSPVVPEVFFAFGGTAGSSVPVPRWATLVIRTQRSGDCRERVREALTEFEPEIAAARAWSLADARRSELATRLRNAPLFAATFGLGVSFGGLGWTRRRR